MKQKRITIAALIVCAAFGTAFAQDADTLRIEQLHSSVVTATAAPKDAPFAISTISGQQIEKFSKEARELPFLLARTPGVLAWGDNGLGTGTTYLRIRGAGDSRINVTLDGIPLNSPEDQCVFWANMNSYSSFLGGAMIQRGIGSSSNGDGAFGGTVALFSKAPSMTPSSEISFSYGSYNTMKAGANISSGLLRNKWMLDASFHATSTDGYMHGTAGQSGSWIVSVTYAASGDLIIKYRNIGNYEHTGQAWNGVDSGDLLDGNYGMTTGIHGYADLYRVGLGRYNSLCEYYVKDSDGNYSFVEFPQITTDNFFQDHNILSASWQIDSRWNAGASLHYTYGEGYYDQFRSNRKLSDFGLVPIIGADGAKLSRTDFVRKKGLYQNTFGTVINVSRVTDRSELRFGLSAQNFTGNHYGYITYVGDSVLSDRLLSNGDYKYYDSDAWKTDLSAFVKENYSLGAGFSAFADLQYRFVTYRTDGINDKFYQQSDGSYINHVLDINETYNFFNPKAGLEFRSGIHNAFASVALGHREPERNNFTDNGSYPAPKPERMWDYELGYGLDGEVLKASLTLYYMDYHDQFVQTGQLSDIGESLTTNIAKSYRNGAELSAALKASRWLDFEATGALSRNRILDFDEVVEDWDRGSTTVHYDDSALAFSPSAILGGGFSLHSKGARLDWHTSYVSKQYLDNSENDSRSLPAYSTTDLHLSYTLVPARSVVRDMTFALNLGNIFNAHYAASGWVYSAICESYGHPESNRYREIGYYPGNAFSVLGSFTIRF